MRKVKFLGSPCNLGRHGRVNTGDTLYLREGEWSTVQSDPDFELDGSVELSETQDGAILMPVGTEVFDLRTVKWNSGRLDRHLGRWRKSRLLKIAEAMNMVGLPVKSGNDFAIEDLVDSIQYHAVTAGWDKLTKEEILAAGKYIPTRRRK